MLCYFIWKICASKIRMARASNKMRGNLRHRPQFHEDKLTRQDRASEHLESTIGCHNSFTTPGKLVSGDFITNDMANAIDMRADIQVRACAHHSQYRSR
jgi:hypothetical protein